MRVHWNHQRLLNRSAALLLLLLGALALSGCAHAWDMDKPCPAGTAWTFCDGVPQCAPAGVSPCGPNQVPVH